MEQTGQFGGLAQHVRQYTSYRRLNHMLESSWVSTRPFVAARKLLLLCCCNVSTDMAYTIYLLILV
jgi:hypothetical protein